MRHDAYARNSLLRKLAWSAWIYATTTAHFTRVAPRRAHPGRDLLAWKKFVARTKAKRTKLALRPLHAVVAQNWWRVVARIWVAWRNFVARTKAKRATLASRPLQTLVAETNSKAADRTWLAWNKSVAISAETASKFAACYRCLVGLKRKHAARVADATRKQKAYHKRLVVLALQEWRERYVRLARDLEWDAQTAFSNTVAIVSSIMVPGMVAKTIYKQLPLEKRDEVHGRMREVLYSYAFDLCVRTAQGVGFGADLLSEVAVHIVDKYWHWTTGRNARADEVVQSVRLAAKVHRSTGCRQFQLAWRLLAEFQAEKAKALRACEGDSSG